MLVCAPFRRAPRLHAGNRLSAHEHMGNPRRSSRRLALVAYPATLCSDDSADAILEGCGPPLLLLRLLRRSRAGLPALESAAARAVLASRRPRIGARTLLAAVVGTKLVEIRVGMNAVAIRSSTTLAVLALFPPAFLRLLDRSDHGTEVTCVLGKVAELLLKLACECSMCSPKCRSRLGTGWRGSAAGPLLAF
ncbi:hypothetical protein BDY21DRAFT_2769 [Lineolata rhizophorae]|uniref:Uncharacterized protein n=1 Tax=Lineolata rhizophorae TaxID=578093 RepID=A0A6A6PEP7_9PEZI|nr:hypothetical protein BDY21DRAFT_2769 [Lineolata rhizophorae]